MIKVALVALIVLGNSPFAFAQSGSDCHRNTMTKNLLIRTTKNRVRAVMENYAEGISYFIEKDSAICSNKEILTAIVSVPEFIPLEDVNAGIKILIKSIKFIPAAACKAIVYYNKRDYVRPESAYMDDFTEALKQMSYEDVMTTCEEMDPDKLDLDYFKKELKGVVSARRR